MIGVTMAAWLMINHSLIAMKRQYMRIWALEAVIFLHFINHSSQQAVLLVKYSFFMQVLKLVQLLKAPLTGHLTLIMIGIDWKSIDKKDCCKSFQPTVMVPRELEFSLYNKVDKVNHKVNDLCSQWTCLIGHTSKRMINAHFTQTIQIRVLD